MSNSKNGVADSILDRDSIVLNAYDENRGGYSLRELDWRKYVEMYDKELLGFQRPGYTKPEEFPDRDAAARRAGITIPAPPKASKEVWGETFADKLAPPPDWKPKKEGSNTPLPPDGEADDTAGEKPEMGEPPGPTSSPEKSVVTMGGLIKASNQLRKKDEAVTVENLAEEGGYSVEDVQVALEEAPRLINRLGLATDEHTEADDGGGNAIRAVKDRPLYIADPSLVATILEKARSLEGKPARLFEYCGRGFSNAQITSMLGRKRNSIDVGMVRLFRTLGLDGVPSSRKRTIVEQVARRYLAELAEIPKEESLEPSGDTLEVKESQSTAAPRLDEVVIERALACVPQFKGKQMYSVFELCQQEHTYAGIAKRLDTSPRTVRVVMSRMFNILGLRQFPSGKERRVYVAEIARRYFATKSELEIVATQEPAEEKPAEASDVVAPTIPQDVAREPGPELKPASPKRKVVVAVSPEEPPLPELKTIEGDLVATVLANVARLRGMEFEVFKCAARAMNNRQIAEELKVTSGVVSGRFNVMYEHLGLARPGTTLKRQIVIVAAGQYLAAHPEIAKPF